MDHLDQSTFSDRHNDNIEEEEAGKCDEHFDKIGLMSKVRKSFKELILFLEYNHIGKCDLIEKNEKKPEHSDEWGNEVEFFQRVKSSNELPCREDDGFFHWVVVYGMEGTDIYRIILFPWIIFSSI